MLVYTSPRRHLRRPEKELACMIYRDTDIELNDDAPVCGRCISEAFLAKKIQDEGQRDTCAFCEEELLTVPIATLADEVDRVYRLQAVAVEDWHGEPADVAAPLDNVSKLLGCSEPVAEEILKKLQASSTPYIKDGHPDLYADDEHSYEIDVRCTDEYQLEKRRLDSGWFAFEVSLQHESRFDNAGKIAYLDSLFDQLIKGEFFGEPAPIIKAGPGSAFEFIYRGRDASDSAHYEAIFANPARELSSPPPRKRKQGRMNAVGIAAFYGCAEATTCVAELRVPVGGTTIVGRFRVLRTLRLLDLRQIESGVPSSLLSRFDARYLRESAYRDFMRSLHDTIRKPILPDDESLNYITTQFIAEYLSQRSEDIDGIVYDSAQMTRDVSQPHVGLDLVLFAKAAVVKDANLPTRFSIDRVRMAEFEDTEYEDAVYVVREPLKSDSTNNLETKNNSDPAPSLELELHNLSVVRVKGISYDVSERNVYISDDTEPLQTSFLTIKPEN